MYLLLGNSRPWALLPTWREMWEDASSQLWKQNSINDVDKGLQTGATLNSGMRDVKKYVLLITFGLMVLGFADSCQPCMWTSRRLSKMWHKTGEFDKKNLSECKYMTWAILNSISSGGKRADDTLQASMSSLITLAVLMGLEISTSCSASMASAATVKGSKLYWVCTVPATISSSTCEENAAHKLLSLSFCDSVCQNFQACLSSILIILGQRLSAIRLAWRLEAATMYRLKSKRDDRSHADLPSDWLRVFTLKK